MSYRSKHSFKRKQQQQKQAQLKRLVVDPQIRIYQQTIETRILKNNCDLCNDQLPKEADNIQHRINILDEIDASYESEKDKHEPRLLLCSFCSNEYNIPSYFT